MSTYAQDVPRIISILAEETTDEGDTTKEPMREVDVYIEEDRITIIPKTAPIVESIKPEVPKSNEHAPITPQAGSMLPAYVIVSMYLYLIPATIFFQLYFIFNAPTATIYLYPTMRTITMNAAIRLPGQSLPAFTLSQSTTVPATGKGHQNSEQARGYVTFYNGSFSPQPVPAGTVFTGSDGVHIATDESVTVPPNNPPEDGQASVSAHAINPGTSGNIVAGDISVALSTDLLTKNLAAFTGGQDERDFTIVTKADLFQAATALKTSLSNLEGAALNSQLRPGEARITPPCSAKTTSDHHAGDEAKSVTVTVAETYTGIAYDAHQLQQDATRMIQQRATSQLGTGYSLVGNVQATIIHTALSGQAHMLLSVKITGTFVYQISKVAYTELARLIAGKSKEQAMKLLSQTPGIQTVTIVFSGNTALPKDAGRIHIIVIETAG